MRCLQLFFSLYFYCKQPRLAFLVFDFAMRAYFKNRFSIISAFSRYVSSKFDNKSILISAVPKIFAARVGLILTSF